MHGTTSPFLRTVDSSLVRYSRSDTVVSFLMKNQRILEISRGIWPTTLLLFIDFKRIPYIYICKWDGGRFTFKTERWINGDKSGVRGCHPISSNTILSNKKCNTVF